MIPEIFPALGLAIIFIIAVYLLERREQGRLANEDASLDSCRYSTATIARNLAPKLKALMATKDFSAPTIYIVGGDGYPLWTLDNSYPWRDLLREILKRGGTVHYILTDAEPMAVAKIQEQRLKLQSGVEGKINCYFAQSKFAKDSEKAVIESFQTFHPTLIEGTSERAMWIEGYHPKNSTVAYNCQFINPVDAASNLDYAKYKELLLQLIENWSDANRKAAA